MFLSPVNNISFKSSAGVLNIHSPLVTNYIELERHFRPHTQYMQQQSSSMSNVPFQKGEKTSFSKAAGVKIDIKA